MMNSQRHNPNAKRHASGFTLLEVILAITITAVVSATLFTSLSGAFDMRRQVEEHLSGRETSRAVMAILQADLEAVPRAGGRISGVFMGESDTGMNNADTDAMLYVTANPALRTDQDLADLRQVELRLLKSKDDEDYYVLARLVTGNLLARTVPEPAVQVLARRVVSLDLKYYDNGEWIDEWNSTLRENAIPQAVQVVLVIAPEWRDEPEDEDERQAKYITTTQVFRLPAAEESTGGLGGLGIF